MSKKNSSVILKNNFRDLSGLDKIYFNFKKKLFNLKQKSYLVAVSGGPDSLALVALSKAYDYEIKTNFYYVLVNHNIRAESYKESKRVKRILRKKKINLKILENKAKFEKNIQGNARKARYSLLEDFCKKKKIKIILTAHNLEDQVETFFIRLSRGSGLTGLSSMKPLTSLNKTVKIYRPLLDINKKNLVKISNIIFGEYIEDPSNNNINFLRTKIRNLRKYLEKSGINYTQITKSINNLASSRDTLDQFLFEIFKDTIKKTYKEVLIDLKKFERYNNEIKIRIINKSINMLLGNYYSPRSKKVLNLIRNFDNKRFKSSTLAGCIFVKKNNQICLKKEKKL